MARLGFAQKSIEIYVGWLIKLHEFYPRKDLRKLTFEEIKAFIDHHVSKGRVSASAINIALHATILLYNRLWNRDFDFTRIHRPKTKRAHIEILSEDETITLIETTSNTKQKAVIALTYSSGLDLSEVSNLKPVDIDFKRHVIKVRDKNGRTKRESVLSKYAELLTKKHIEENSPRKFLFEGYRPGYKYSARSIQHMFHLACVRAGITRKLTFKVLKYSYVLHLEKLGISIRTTLRALGLKNSESLDFFSEISSRGEAITFSPLDKIMHKEEEDDPIDVRHLEESIVLVKDKDERAYLHEALVCINSGSLRAGIIFAWNAAVVNIRNKCFTHGKVTMNQAVQKHDQKARTISKMDDFAHLKDSVLLLVFQELGHVDKSEKDALVDCLNLRNKCGHPSQYRPKTFKAMSFLEELLTIVFNKQ